MKITNISGQTLRQFVHHYLYSVPPQPPIHSANIATRINYLYFPIPKPEYWNQSEDWERNNHNLFNRTTAEGPEITFFYQTGVLSSEERESVFQFPREIFSHSRFPFEVRTVCIQRLIGAVVRKAFDFRKCVYAGEHYGEGAKPRIPHLFELGVHWIEQNSSSDL